jgi:hypothetical protein
MKKYKFLVGGLVLGLLIALALLGKFWHSKYQLDQVNSQLNERLMQANLAIGKAHTEFGEANDYINELEEALQQEIEDRNEVLTRYGKLQARYRAVSNQKPAIKVETIYVQGETIEVPVADTFVRGLLYEAITDKTLQPLEEIRSIQSDHRISIACIVKPVPNTERVIPVFIEYQLDMRLAAELVETRAPTGAVNYYVNIYEIGPDGLPVGKMEITDFQMTVNDYRTLGMRWWAPHIDVGLIGGGGFPGGLVGGGTMGVSFMGYGRTDNDLILRFPRVAVSLTGAMGSKLLPGIGIDPIQYNIGEHLPLISNMWLSPHVGYKLDGSWILALGVSAVL